MESRLLNAPSGDLKTKLYWLMGLRVAVVTLLLGLSLVLQAESNEPVQTFYTLIIITYALTLLYAVLLRWLRSPQALSRLAYAQLAADLALETYLIGRTGGIESPFAVFYMITVTLASLIVRREGGLATMGLSVALFGLIAVLQSYGLSNWVSPGRLSAAITMYAFSVHGLAFTVVGLLSGALAQQLAQADQSLFEKEQGLSRLQAFHENVVQSVSSGLFTTDAVGRITSFNRAAREITRHRLEEVLHRFWSEVFSWEQPDLFQADASTLTTPYRFEGEGKRADGVRIVLGMTLAPLTENGIRTGLVGVFQDLTKIRDMEEQIRRKEWLATLGEMSAGIAHEIRNPLAALAGSMQMLRQDLHLDGSNGYLMDIAIREAARLDAIITEFLLYARPPALNLKECDINAVLAETLDLIRHEVRDRNNIGLMTYPGPGVMTAQVDPDQIKQVLWNLAMNALQAMPHGGRLTISTGRRRIDSGAKSGEVIEILFRDTGEGIKREVLGKVFLPFFTTKKRGSGLGLAAVHRIVDLHGGWIRVDSQEGKGSQFVVCLPVFADAGPRLWHEGREPWKRS